MAVFSLAMFLSRSMGDTVLGRCGERRVLTTITVVVAGSVAFGSMAAHPLVMVVALGLTGLALGPVFPVAISRAGRAAPGRVAAMTARVSAVGYLAYLGGPPVIGLVAEAVGLPNTLAAVVVLGCAGILVARRGSAAAAPGDAAPHE